MSAKQNVKAMILKGHCLNDIFHELPNYTQSTLRTYVARITASLTEAERKQRDASRAQRPRQRHDYHRKYQERTILGPVQVRIGRKLAEARLNSEMKSEEFCKQHAFANRAKLSLMEQGYHDFTVTEIQKIADLLQINVEELLTAARDRDLAA
ncbi:MULTISPECIES: hypothetical protein [unclassified Methylobacterium]|uniref:hypothetical protein n=1 Tax=unclassified Methylobacterium TaxID=2615210 RepID=UPI0011C20909|nr:MULTISPECIES: hypothetical protein [unclassified Methylobacterium]QEE37974.1 hypothetical protein FVA80_02315 [Methylobacterium sp. WL1]TXN59814.1 hypothetical protein FV241_00145 [Methylobacterium sp. WL2]